MVVGHRRVMYARSVDRDHRRVFLHAYQSDIDAKHARPQHAVHILGVVGGGGGVYVCRGVCVWVGGGITMHVYTTSTRCACRCVRNRNDM